MEIGTIYEIVGRSEKSTGEIVSDKLQTSGEFARSVEGTATSKSLNNPARM